MKRILFLIIVLFIQTELFSNDQSQYIVNNLVFDLANFSSYNLDSHRKTYVSLKDKFENIIDIAFLSYKEMNVDMDDSQIKMVLNRIISKKKLEDEEINALIKESLKYGNNGYDLFSKNKYISINNIKYSTISMELSIKSEKITFPISMHISLYTDTGIYYLSYILYGLKNKKLSDILGKEYGPYDKEGRSVSTNNAFAEKILNELMENKFTGSQELIDLYTNLVTVANSSQSVQ